MNIQVGFCGVLVASIIILKLAGIGMVANWSWLVILGSIIWVPIALVLAWFGVVLTVMVVASVIAFVCHTIKGNWK